jgi:hypothetical protein
VPLFFEAKAFVGMLHSKGRAGVPTTLAETIIYKMFFVAL